MQILEVKEQTHSAYKHVAIGCFNICFYSTAPPVDFFSFPNQMQSLFGKLLFAALQQSFFSLPGVCVYVSES